MALFASGNFPAITIFEAVVVISAAVFFAVTPAIVALVDARRRRALSMPTTLAPAEPMPFPVVSPVEPSFETPTALGPASEDIAWPVEAPVGSPDFRGEFEDASTSAVSASTVDAVAVDVPVITDSESVPPPAADSAVEALAPEWVYRGPLIEVVPPVATGTQSFQLLELRQARLTNWPPSSVRSHPAQRDLWEEGERIAARHDRQISSATLSWERPLQAVAYAGVATDGEMYRLRFLLFDDMWPSDADQACAVATFEISADGLQRNWLEAR